jgi:hypothetical protein
MTLHHPGYRTPEKQSGIMQHTKTVVVIMSMNIVYHGWVDLHTYLVLLIIQQNRQFYISKTWKTKFRRFSSLFHGYCVLNLELKPVHLHLVAFYCSTTKLASFFFHLLLHPFFQLSLQMLIDLLIN